jgi:hypothetical protein
MFRAVYHVRFTCKFRYLCVFRGVNIVEYRSPGTSLTVDDFHKVGAYARLYSVQNGVETADMSVSFAVGAHPRKVFEYLRGWCSAERPNRLACSITIPSGRRAAVQGAVPDYTKYSSMISISPFRANVSTMAAISF